MAGAALPQQLWGEQRPGSTPTPLRALVDFLNEHRISSTNSYTIESVITPFRTVHIARFHGGSSLVDRTVSFELSRSVLKISADGREESFDLDDASEVWSDEGAVVLRFVNGFRLTFVTSDGGKRDRLKTLLEAIVSRPRGVQYD